MSRKFFVLLIITFLLPIPVQCGPIETLRNIFDSARQAAEELFAIAMVALFVASIILLIIFIGKMITGQRVWGVASLWTWIMTIGLIAFVFYLIGTFSSGGGGGNPGENLVYTIAKGLAQVINNGINRILGGGG